MWKKLILFYFVFGGQEAIIGRFFLCVILVFPTCAAVLFCSVLVC